MLKLSFSLALLFGTIVCLLSQQPIAHWPFDEISGLTTQEQISGQVFDVKNEYPKQESEHKPGVSNHALRFNGYATWVEGSLSATLPTDQITVTAWIAPEVFPFSSAAIFTNVSGNTGVYLGIDKFGRIEIGATVNGFFSQKISADKIPLWQWSHIALTVNTGKIRAFLNGVQVAEQNTQPGEINWNIQQTLKLGKHQNSPLTGLYETGLFCGLIDELKIFGQALAENELSAIVGAETPPLPPDMSIPESRFEGDLHRPIFHAIPPANWMNEPHGLVYHNGLYHIFYQKNGNGPYFGRLNWGHQTSPNLLTWTEHPVALSPFPSSYDQEGCWSGCSIKKNGTPYIMYTGVDGSTAQMCLAESNTDVTEYQKFAGNPVVATPPAPYTAFDFRDPYIWEENGSYYMIIGTGLGGTGNSGGATLLYKSANLTSWQYLDVMHKGFPQTDNSGVFWEVPMFLNFNGKRVLTVQPVPQPGIPARILYWTGNFENEEFITDTELPKLLEPGDNLLGVTTTIDPQGRLIAIGIIPDILPGSEQQKNGWANLMSLPRIWSLSSDGNTLLQKPLPELDQLRSSNHHFDNLEVSAGQSGFLPDIQGRHLEIRAKINPGTASRVGLVIAKAPDNSERTRIFWDVPLGILQIERSNSSINPSTPKGTVSTLFQPVEGQPLDLHIFLDGSVLEVFINEEKALSTRIYPENAESVELDLFTQGGTANIQSLDIWAMKNMHDSTLSVGENIRFSSTNVIEKVYPNPTTGEFVMDINMPVSGELRLQMLNVIGETVGSQFFGVIEAGKISLPFHQKDLPAGVFFLQIWQDKKLSGATKIIKH